MRARLLFIVVSICTSLNAQHVTTFIGNHYENVDSVFFLSEALEELDTSSFLSTGLLWDRAPYHIPINQFDGSEQQDSIMEKGKIMQCYMDIRGAAIDSTILPDYDSLISLISNLSEGYNAIPVISFHYDLDHIKTNVFDENILSFENGKLSIIDNQNPFDQIEFFAAQLSHSDLPVQDTFYIVAPLITFFNNQSTLPNSMEINFNDNNGWQALPWNEPTPFFLSEETENLDYNIRVSYASSSDKYSNNSAKSYSMSSCVFPQPQSLPCNITGMNVTVPVMVKLPNGQFTIQNQTRYYQNYFESDEEYKGKKGRGKAYMRYGINNNLKKMDKPLIIVEGIDFGKATESGIRMESTIQLGNFGWPQLFNCRNRDDDNNLIYPVEKMPDLMEELYQENYDVILLDFHDGADYMQRNGLLLKKLINRINQCKNSEESIVILGVSMGGQIVRRVLTEMEHNDEDHCVRLFVSHDSPWKGANIPPSVQYFAHYMAVMGNEEEAKKMINNQLNRPAARQLLFSHYTNIGSNSNIVISNTINYHIGYNDGNGYDPLRTQFNNELAQLGNYPKKSRNISIANGNGNGSTKFSNGSAFMTGSGSCYFFNYRIDLYDVNKSNNEVVHVKQKSITGARYFVYGLPNLSNAPGGSRIRDIGKIYNSAAEEVNSVWGCSSPFALHQGSYTFVPTVSALDINYGGNWNFNVNNSQINKENASLSGLTHFDAIHVYGNNQDSEHGKVTDDNIEWLMRHINNGSNALYTQSGGSLNTFWNSPSENNQLTGINIGSNGILQVNGFNHIYDDPNLPANLEGTLSKVKLGGTCTSSNTINVNNGGKLILGDDNQENNRAYLYIGENSTIDVKAGGEVLIHANSRLIVQEGGKLKISGNALIKAVSQGRIIIEDGGVIEYLKDATIELTGTSSHLEIKGKVIVGDDAVFGFSGNGRIIIDQFIYSGVYNNFWDIGSNAKMELEGPTHYGQVLLECKSNFVPRMENSHTFENISIIRGKAIFHPGKHMSITCPLYIRHMEITVPSGMENDPTKRHGGLLLWGNHNSNTTIISNRFYHGNYGLRSNQPQSTSALIITTSEFKNCNKGIEIIGKRFQASGCDFEDNIYGIFSELLHGSSTIASSNFKNNQVGAALHGQSGAETEINSSTFTLTHPAGVEKGVLFDEHPVILRCNLFSNLDIGIHGLDESYADLLDNASNEFSNCNTGMLLVRADGFNMYDGYNKFNNSVIDISMYTLSFPNTASIQQQGQPAKLDLSNNTMRYCDNCPDLQNPISVPSLNDGWYNVFTYNLGTTILTHNPDYAQTFDPCVSSPGSGLAELGMLANLSSERVISTPGGSLNLMNAVIEAGEMITNSNSGEETLDDETAFEWLEEIAPQLTEDFLNLTPDEIKIMNVVLKMKQKALAQLYAQQILTFDHGQGTPPSSEVTAINNHIVALISEYGTPSDTTEHDRQALLNLERAYAYRQGGFYNEALSILFEYPSQVSPRIFDKWSYWDCACNVEASYFSGSIEAEELAEYIANCYTQFSPRVSHTTYDVPEQNEDGRYKKKFNLVIYPNPTGDFLYFRTENLAEPEEIIRKEMFNLLGVKVYSEEAKASYVQRVDVRNLPSGSYILEVTGGGKTYQKKVIVN